jgi:transposase-like protein
VALTDEQRTMLQLLLEGGQSYEDIGSLLGISADEVRSRARTALREIGGADPDGQVGLSDYLLGQADPIGRADAVRQLQSDPETNALAQRLVQNLRLLAPKAQLPEIPEPRGGRGAAPPPPAQAQPAAPPAPGVPPPSTQGPGFAHRAAGAFSGLGGLTGKRRTQFVVGTAAVLALLIVVIVVATSGGSSNGEDCKGVDTAAAQQAGVPTIKLAATGAAADADCPPSGQITLGATQAATNNQNQTPTFALQANAVHLQPSTDGERYLLWLYKSDTESLPLGQETVDDSGNLTGGVPLIAQQVLLLPAFDSIRISRVTSTESQQIQQSLQQQGKKAGGVVQFVGQPVLQGSISELGLDQLLQQAQQQAGSTGQGSGKKG